MSLLFIENATAINERLRNNQEVILKPGIYDINESININSNNILRGKRNLSVILRATSGNFPIIKCVGVENIQIQDLVLERKDTPIMNNCYGIYIYGKKIRVSHVNIFNASSGVYLQTDLKEFINQDIVLNKINFTNEVADENEMFPASDFRQFGLEANSVKNLIVTNCHWSHAGLDGIKLRHLCYDVKIIGGSSNNNGLKYSSFDFNKCILNKVVDEEKVNLKDIKLPQAGDGIDCFAGGEKVVIDGTKFEKNKGNGITIKSVGGFVPGSIDEICSPIKDYQIRGVITNNNMGYGIAIEGVYDSIAHADKKPRFTSYVEDRREKAQNILIKNCTFQNDHGSGLFLNGTQITVINCRIIGSCYTGIKIAEHALGIVIKQCKIISCGKIKNENTIYNLERGVIIEERAKGIILSDTTFDGKNPANESLPLHQFGIYIWERTISGINISADQVYIIDCISINNSNTMNHGPAFIGREPASGYIYIEHSGSLETPEKKVSAGLGSRYFNPKTRKRFIKTQDAFEKRDEGWTLL